MAGSWRSRETKYLLLYVPLGKLEDYFSFYRCLRLQNDKLRKNMGYHIQITDGCGLYIKKADDAV